MALKLITAPTAEPVTLAEAKLHLRVDTTDEDTLITNMIQTAREYCEGFQNRAYLDQEWELVLDEFPAANHIEIPRPPLQSVVSLTYVDNTGASTVWDAANYIADTASEPGRLVLAYGKTWPSVTLQPAGGVKVRFKAGYPNTEVAKVSQKVKLAMLLLVGHWYEHREAVAVGTVARDIEFAVEALLWQDRVVTFG